MQTHTRLLLQQVNDHHVELIYSTAAWLQQQRSQAGTVGVSRFVLKVIHEWGKRGVQSMRPVPVQVDWRFTAAQWCLNPRRSMPSTFMLCHCLLLSLYSISIHRLTASTNRLQVDRGGGCGVISSSLMWGTSMHLLLPTNLPCISSYPLFCTCTVLVCRTSDGCLLSRFTRESSRFHTREIGINKKAQLTLSSPRDVKACQNCSNSTCFVSFHRISFPQIANA